MKKKTLLLPGCLAAGIFAWALGTLHADAAEGCTFNAGDGIIWPYQIGSKEQLLCLSQNQDYNDYEYLKKFPVDGGH